ncbi:MAG: hypothetical protein HGB29_03565 [Chlorobiaceae bacterium]|nr:hypothetical protein [Chlorobiaceae bacterium]NTW73921.1 hypothetical protein [Chlorobiaceae bacterium]
MTIILLLIIMLLLLIAIVAIMVTGWPGREQAEIERIGNSLHREMAEHRTESIQLLHAIRIEIEDSVKESIEREMAAYGPRGRSRSSKTKKIGEPKEPDATIQDPVGTECVEELSVESVLAARQFLLFDDDPATTFPSSPQAAVASLDEQKEPDPGPQTIFVGYIDDIPDVD